METPQWHPASELPDSDLTVLVHHPDEDEPVGMGYHDGQTWRAADAMRVNVTHWMPIPEPPTAL